MGSVLLTRMRIEMATEEKLFCRGVYFPTYFIMFPSLHISKYNLSFLNKINFKIRGRGIKDTAQIF